VAITNGHAERALESLLVDDPLLHRVQLARRRVGQPFDRHDLLAAHGVREHRARVARHVVDQYRAGAALRAIAAKLGAGQPQLVAQRHGERFLRHHVDAAILAVHVQRDEALDRARGRLAVHRRRAEQIRRRRGDGAGSDDALDEIPSRH